MVPLSILWYRESWTIQLKYTFETRQERIRASYNPTHRHDHAKPWYVHVALNVGIIHDMYMKMNWVYVPEPGSSGANTSSNPQVSTHIPRHASDGMGLLFWKCKCLITSSNGWNSIHYSKWFIQVFHSNMVMIDVVRQIYKWNKMCVN